MKNNECDLSEQAIEDTLNYMRDLKRDENGNIPIKLTPPTYILTDGDIELIKIIANGKNLYDYIEKIMGPEAKIITSCKSIMLLNKAKLERDSSKGDI
jgi:hypothetical protein